ncbi:MAG: hypothetical protein ACU837_10700 [Gammaproteobacteria bacterium]
MKTQTKKIIVSATSYDIDGITGGSLYLVQPSSGRNPNIIGCDILKMKCDYDLARSKIDQQDGRIPGIYQILMRIEAGSRNKARPVAESVTELKESDIVLDFIKDARKQQHQYKNQDDVATGLILGASKYEINERQKGGRLYLLSPADEMSQNAWAGFQVVAFDMEYELFQKIKSFEKRLPGFVSVQYEFDQGSGSTPKFLATDVNLANAGNTPAAANQPPKQGA